MTLTLQLVNLTVHRGKLSLVGLRSYGQLGMLHVLCLCQSMLWHKQSTCNCAPLKPLVPFEAASA